MGKQGAPAPSQIVIASDLASGRVVFLTKNSTADGVEWGGLIETSLVASDAARGDELLAWAEADAAVQNGVIEPYLIEVVEENGKLRPTKYREEIRCLGPTIRQDLGKQAEGASA